MSWLHFCIWWKPGIYIKELQQVPPSLIKKKSDVFPGQLHLESKPHSKSKFSSGHKNNCNNLFYMMF